MESFPIATMRLMLRVRAISKQPIRALILTDNDESNTGNNAKFLEAGTPIVAQENARAALASYKSASDKIGSGHRYLCERV